MALYIIGTPIGNLGDMPPRAVEVLSSCDFAAAEDTRVTQKLLTRFGINVRLLSYHEHNRSRSGAGILERLENGETGALVSDAGMPVISDPGQELVSECHTRSIPVLLVPGPSALTCALALSGLPSGRFCFEGFLSVSRKNRYEHLDELKSERRTMVFYEAPHKLMNTLRDMLEFWGDRRASVSREMTKLHEETLTGTLSSLAEHFSKIKPKGEIVLIVEGAGKPQPLSLEATVELALSHQELPPSQAARLVAKSSGRSRREIYEKTFLKKS